MNGWLGASSFSSSPSSTPISTSRGNLGQQSAQREWGIYGQLLLLLLATQSSFKLNETVAHSSRSRGDDEGDGGWRTCRRDNRSLATLSSVTPVPDRM